VTDSAPSRSSFSLRSIALVVLAAGGQLVLLLVLQVVQARLFGASADMDAYLCAYAIPLVLGGILAGASGAAVVPFYSERRAAAGDAEAMAAASTVGWCLAALSTSIAGLLFVSAGPLITAVYRDLTVEQIDQATSLLRTLCWLVPLTAMTGYYFGLFHSRQRFLWPALTGLFGPALTVGLLLLAGTQPSISDLAWAVLLGSALGTASLILPALEMLRPSRTSLSGAVRFLPYVTPILIAAAYSRLDIFVDRFLGTQLPAGTISHMGYASRIVAAVASLTTSGLSVVIFPSLARHAAAGDRPQLQRDLQEGWNWLVVTLVPVVLGLVVCGQPIIAALLQRGAFTERDVSVVSQLLQLSTGFLVGAAVAEIASRTLTAMNRVWITTAIGIALFTFASLTKVLVVRTFGAAGLILTTSVSALTTAVALVAVLHRLGIREIAGGLGKTLVRAACASLLAVGTGRAIMLLRGPWAITLGVAAAILIYCLLMLAMKDEFAVRAFAAMRSWGRRAE
jgi:putative peptidoglycan lipid II flippase